MFPAGFQRQECVQCLESSGREVDQRAGEEWQVTGCMPVLSWTRCMLILLILSEMSSLTTSVRNDKTN